MKQAISHGSIWQMNLAASYIDTEWTEARAPVTVGERLVYAPRANARLGLQYNFDLSAYPAFVRTDISYIGEYETSLQASVSLKLAIILRSIYVLG